MSKPPLFIHFAQFVKTEDLKAARVGKNGPRPRHEFMQAAKLADDLNSGAKVKMIGIAQQNLYAKIFQKILRYALDRSNRAHRHKHRRFDFAVGRQQASGASRAVGLFDLQFQGHCVLRG